MPRETPVADAVVNRIERSKKPWFLKRLLQYLTRRTIKFDKGHGPDFRGQPPPGGDLGPPR